MQPDLAHCIYIDCDAPSIRAKAREPAAASTSGLGLVERCLEFVRDRIRHSWDYQLNPVTCHASDVLRYGTGYCYAKSSCWRCCYGPMACRPGCATSACR